jgi:beta-phosphoglucomutase-like phosphatase (HAD superfamily)
MQLTSFPNIDGIMADFPSTKAFLWDMDGTIIDTEELHAQSLWELLPEGSYPMQRFEFDQFCIGKTDHQIFNYFQERGLFADQTTNQLIDKKNELFIELLKRADINSLFSPSIKSFFLRAKQQRINIAVVTSSEKVIAKTILEEIGLNSYIDLLVTREDTSENKPLPAPYLLALKHLNVSADQCICFEDSETGLTAAKAAQIPTYQAAWY